MTEPTDKPRTDKRGRKPTWSTADFMQCITLLERNGHPVDFANMKRLMVNELGFSTTLNWQSVRAGLEDYLDERKQQTENALVAAVDDRAKLRVSAAMQHVERILLVMLGEQHQQDQELLTARLAAEARQRLELSAIIRDLRVKDEETQNENDRLRARIEKLTQESASARKRIERLTTENKKLKTVTADRAQIKKMIASEFAQLRSAS